ncbi:MAG: MaoC family dehydratase [Rhizobiaceae bacterium]|nr:MaoC family dehydratase [Rhizobiaceae bacterium]MCV0408544.1 MaoC family dehydratase [Rhizobiaceae bacterium]
MSDMEKKFGLGETIVLGSHTFGAEEIVTFASKYDPQPFHLTQEAAEKSVFGNLCASGWHTISVWMRHNAAAFADTVERSRAYGDPIEYGPAAGLKDLKWLKPVYVGDTITFTRTPRTIRALASRPGWYLLNSLCGAINQKGEPVMSFEVNVLMKG